MRVGWMPLLCLALAGDGPRAVAQDAAGVGFGRLPGEGEPQPFFAELESEPPVLVSLLPTAPRVPPRVKVALAAARTREALAGELAGRGLVFGDPVFVRIFKEEQQLEVWVRRRETGRYELFRVWQVAAWGGALGPKLAEGDGQSPEGFYSVPRARLQPNTHNHLAFNIGYPNAYDRALGRTGSAILVHGNDVSVGCFAMTDGRIEEIYTLCAAALRNGQAFFRVHCFPFRMTAGRMARVAGEPWAAFWGNLKEGYDWFETEKVPPDVTVENRRYTFKPGS
jgi:murein L,D-transpeptidase YafK